MSREEEACPAAPGLRVPQRHVVSVLGTDPCISLPLLGGWNSKLEALASEPRQHFASTSGGAEGQPSSSSHAPSQDLQKKVFSMLSNVKVDYLLPKKRKHLKKAADNIEVGRANNLTCALLEKDPKIFDADVHFFPSIPGKSSSIRADRSAGKGAGQENDRPAAAPAAAGKGAQEQELEEYHFKASPSGQSSEVEDYEEDIGERISECLRVLCDSEVDRLWASTSGGDEETETPLDGSRLADRLLSLSQEVTANAQVTSAILREELQADTFRDLLKNASEQLRKLVSWGALSGMQDKVRRADKPSAKKGKKSKAAKQSSDSVVDVHGNVTKLNLCLCSCRFALSLMALQGMPKFVYKEELVEDIIGTADNVFKTNVLCELDAEMKSKMKGSDSADGEDEDPETRTRKGASESETVQLALGHIECIVPMMHLLLNRIKIPDTLAVKLSRVLLDCFSVEADFDSRRRSASKSSSRNSAATRRRQAEDNILTSLECVKRASLVLVAEIFAKYPSFQDTILTDIHSKCIRNGLKSQAHTSLASFPRTFHLSSLEQGSNIHVVSALIMLCIQNASVDPSKVKKEEEIQNGEEGSNPSTNAALSNSTTVRLRWADIVWQSIFQELVSSSSQSSQNGYIDRDTRLQWKQVLRLLLQDVLSSFGHLEFPCSSLLLQRITTLLMYQGLKHPEVFVRVTCVELLGEVMAGLISKEKYWKSDELLCLDLESICESIVEASPNASISDGGLLHVVEEMMNKDGGVRDEERTVLGAKDLLQVAYDHLDAEQHTIGSSNHINIRDSPHEACISVMRRAVDLSLDANLRKVKEQSNGLKTDAYMLISSAKSYLGEMSGKIGNQNSSSDESQDKGGISVDNLSHMNSSVSMAIHRERAKSFDPVALQKISVFLSCTQTVVASRFGTFFDRLLELCMSDIQEVSSKKADKNSVATSSSVQVRTKAMKVLSDLCELDDGSLGLTRDPKVHACFDSCIQDDAVSVRESAVDLISRLSSRSQEMALQYFDLIAHACGDPGSSVQRQAIKTLWEVYAEPVDFPLRFEAAATIVVRVPAMEEAVKVRTVRTLRNFWFSNSKSKSKDDSSMEHFCDTLWTIFVEQKKSRNGNGLVIPFSRDHPTVHLLECIFNSSRLDCPGQMKMGGAEKGITVKCGKAFCRQLMDGVLHAESCEASDLGQNANDRALKYLLALHTVLVAVPELCISGNNHHYLIECLMPHLLCDPMELQNGQADPSVAQNLKETKKEHAEKLTCILSIISSNIESIDVLGDQVCLSLTNNLQKLIASHDYLSVVAKACELLCRICKISHTTSQFALKLMSSILDNLEGISSSGQAQEETIPEAQKNATYLRRRLFVLGHLWRNSKNILDSDDTSDTCMITSSLQSILKRTIDVIIFWLVDQNDGEATLRASTQPSLAIEALRALGMVIYGHSEVATSERVKQIYELSLDKEAPPSLQVCGLRGLTEMIKKEESSIIEKQQNQLKENNTVKKRKKSTSNAPLNTVCGEGEVSVAGTVLRYFWEKSILPLSLHLRKVSNAQDQAVTLQVLGQCNRPLKLASMELFESVLRQGLVAPWTAVPSLVALCVYPDTAVYQQACQILRNYILEKRMDFFESMLIDAIQSLYQQSLEISSGCGYFNSGCSKVLNVDMMEGISMLYKLLRVKKQTRTSFLRNLMRGFTKSLQGSGSSSKSGVRTSKMQDSQTIDLNMLAFCSNVCISLPYVHLEEPLQLIHSCDTLVFREASYIESSLELMATYAEDIKAGNPVPLDLKLIGQKAACISLLLEIKRVLRKVYSISDNQIANYSEKQGKSLRDLRSVKCKTSGSVSGLALDSFNGVEIGNGEHAWVSQCKTFKKLMKQDGLHSTRHIPKAMQSPNSEATYQSEGTNPSEMTTPSQVSMDERYTPNGRSRNYPAGDTPQSRLENQNQKAPPKPTRRVPKRKLMDAFSKG